MSVSPILSTKVDRLEYSYIEFILIYENIRIGSILSIADQGQTF